MQCRTLDDKSNIFILHYKYLQLGAVKAQPDSAICTERNAVSQAPLFALLWQHQEIRKSTVWGFPCSKENTSSIVNSLPPLLPKTSLRCVVVWLVVCMATYSTCANYPDIILFNLLQIRLPEGTW